MPSLGTLIGDIRTDINRGTDFDARIRLAIARAVEFYSRTRFAWNTKRVSFDLSAGAEYVTLSTDVVQIDSLRLAQSDYQCPLDRLTLEAINERDRDPTHTSRPVAYTIENKLLRLWPAPDSQSYSVELSYLYRDVTVSRSASDSLSSAWLTDGAELIQLHATVDVLENYIREDEAIADANRKRLREALVLSELKYEAQQQHASGRLKPWL